jgi:twinkle protein
MIYKAKDLIEEMLHGYRNGKQRGTTTHITEVDRSWTWRPTDLNIWTGYQNEGKSLFLEQLMTLKSGFDGWKHCLFTPENMPITDFYDNIIEMLVGKSCDPHYSHNLMNEAQYLNAIDFVDRHFFIVYPENGWELEAIHDNFEKCVTDHKVNTVTIDPYNKVHHSLGGERGDIYVSNFMTELKRFAVKHEVAYNLVAHQLTARKDELGRYIKPDLNYIKGGGAFADAADNVLYVWRPDRAVDFSSTEVQFGSQKIKKQKLVGIPSDVTGIDFNRKHNRYYFNGRTPFTALDEKKNKPLKNNINFG